MRSHFAEVLTRESVRLAEVTDGATLAGWRTEVIKDLLTPCSPYALALRQATNAPDRDDFLEQWQALIAGAVARVLHAGRAGSGAGSPSCQADSDVDPQRTAVLILAAIHGGNTLSSVAQDPSPLNAALDIAVGPLLRPASSTTAMASPDGGIRNAGSVP